MADDTTTTGSPAAGNSAAGITAAPSDGLAVDAVPAVERGQQEPCPYLDAEFVADTNGQRITDSGVDASFATPACVFYSYPEQPQLVVMVRQQESFDKAMEVVDFAAPIDATSPAQLPTQDPAGAQTWEGGRGPIPDGPTGPGSVYAVAKDTTAVVVWSNQEQSVKAEAIAERTIANLGL